MDQGRKVASAEDMPRDSGASRRFDIAVGRADEEGSTADDRPLTRGLIEETRKRFAVSRVESIDVGALGRETSLDFCVQSAGVIESARCMRASGRITENEDVVTAIVKRAYGFDRSGDPLKS